MLPPDLVQVFTLAGAVLGIVVAIFDLNERWQRRRQWKKGARSPIPANHPLPLSPQPIASATQQQETHPTAELNGEAHAGYEMGYQANKGYEHPLQQEQQGR